MNSEKRAPFCPVDDVAYSNSSDEINWIFSSGYFFLFYIICDIFSFSNENSTSRVFTTYNWIFFENTLLQNFLIEIVKHVILSVNNV